LRTLQLNAVWLILAVTLAAIVGKIFGAAAGARLGGFPGHEAFQLGTGMVARGEVTLIVAAEGIKTGLLNSVAFSAIVAAVLLSTMFTPPLLRYAFARFKLKTMAPVVEPVETNEEKTK
jgi:Kef-type K+ transport system membrane component KefB